MRKLGRVRGQRMSPSPLPKARSKERLPSISPDRGLDRESPTFSRNGKYRRSFDEGRIGLGKGSKPGTLKEYSIRVQCIQSGTSVFETHREREREKERGERDVSYNVIFCHYSKLKTDLCKNIFVFLLHGFGNIFYAVTYPGPGNRGRMSPLTVRENTRTSPLTVVDPDFDQCMQINRYDVIANYRCNDAVCKIFDLLLNLTQYSI